MPLDEDLKIKIVLAMAKLNHPKLVIRHFQRENLRVIPCEKTISRVFDKFLETGSIHDRERSGRPTTATDEKVDEIDEVLSVNPINTQSVILLVKLTCQNRWCIERCVKFGDLSRIRCI